MTSNVTSQQTSNRSGSTKVSFTRHTVTVPSNAFARWIHSQLLPIVTGDTSVIMVANFQRYFGIETDGTISNRFWYVYFTIASTAGEEIFSLMPLLFWYALPIAVPFLTNFVVQLIIGQLLKDVFMLPRPSSPPAPHPLSKNPIVKLQTHFETEFGMPSTHTLSGYLPIVAMLALTRHGINISASNWIAGVVYVLSVGLSRLYLGVHSVYDVIAGGLLGAVLTCILHWYGVYFDDFVYFSSGGLYFIIASLVGFLTWYPRPKPWSACYGTSAQIYGSWLGCALCLWVLFNCAIAEPIRRNLLESSLLVPQGTMQLVLQQLQLQGDGVDSYTSTLQQQQGYNASSTSTSAASVFKSGGASTDYIGQEAGLDVGNYKGLLLRLCCSLLLTGVGKVILKIIPNLLFKFLYEKSILRPHPMEEKDCFGQKVPLSKAYYYEVPVRLFNYGALAAVVLLLCPYSWYFLN